MVDIIYLAKNRYEFTRASFRTLLSTTNWSLVSKLVIYDDSSEDGAFDYLQGFVGENRNPVDTELRQVNLGSPVAVMNDYLDHKPAPLWAKIDNDTIVPPKWLETCLGVMERHPNLDLLGIESVDVPKPNSGYSFYPAEFVGGIGLFRTRAFVTRDRMTPNKHFGFTSWQDKNPSVSKGWLTPSINTFLLDRLPIEPWKSYSQLYVEKGWQRPWEPYDVGPTNLWDWWLKGSRALYNQSKPGRTNLTTPKLYK